MSEQTNNTPYDGDALIRPGANLSFFVWLLLLGVPALMLFLIFGQGM